MVAAAAVATALAVVLGAGCSGREESECGPQKPKPAPGTGVPELRGATSFGDAWLVFESGYPIPVNEAGFVAFALSAADTDVVSGARLFGAETLPPGQSQARRTDIPGWTRPGRMYRADVRGSQAGCYILRVTVGRVEASWSLPFVAA